MLSAEEARVFTLESWESFVENKINKAINDHKTSTEAIKDIPQKIKDGLRRKGFTLRDIYGDDRYHTISWREE